MSDAVAAGLAAFGLVYVWAATRLRWWLCLPLGWAAFLGVAWTLRKAEPNLLLATTAADACRRAYESTAR